MAALCARVMSALCVRVLSALCARVASALCVRVISALCARVGPAVRACGPSSVRARWVRVCGPHFRNGCVCVCLSACGLVNLEIVLRGAHAPGQGDYRCPCDFGALHLGAVNAGANILATWCRWGASAVKRHRSLWRHYLAGADKAGVTRT